MADDKKILIRIEVNDDGSSATLKNFEGKVIASKVSINQLSNAIGNFTVAKGKMDKGVNISSQQLGRLKKNVDGFKNSTGAASSAALELGRIVSDAPYGIRGMANNVSQLASQITFMATSTDVATGKTVGFTGAIRGLWASLAGPLGILLAIQSAVALLDAFAGSTKKAGDESEKTTTSIGKEASGLLALKDALKSGNLSRVEASKLVDSANKKYKDLNLELDENNQLTEQSKKNLDELAKSYIDLAKAQALQSLLTEKYSELLALQAKQQKLDTEANKAEKRAIDALTESYKETGNAVAEATARSARKASEENKKASDEIQKEIDELIKLAGDDGILDRIFNGKEGAKKKRPRAEAVDLEGAEERIKREREFMKKSLELLKDNFDFPDNVFDLLEPIEVDPELPPHLQKAIDEYNRKLVKEFLRVQELEDFQEYAQLFMSVFSNINSFLEAEFDREVTLEQNRTSRLNNELNQRLLNEKLSAEQRREIQGEIWRNDEALRRRQEQIEKKRFRQQKAFNISMATVDTFRAAAGVLADTKGGSFARIAGMVSVITAGLAQVAIIARQQFQSSQATTPVRTGSLGGAGGGADRQFNFNLAGANQANQIAQAIQSQFTQPLRAYVVSSDVTNQQQLESSIQDAASF